MGELILLIISHILVLILGMKIAIHFIADDLFECGKIGISKWKYMKSWQYLCELLNLNTLK